MQTKHTPGPWQIGRRSKDGYRDIDGVCEDRGASHYGLAMVVIEVDKKPYPDGEANAHLIAAAPDLLKCLTMGAQVNTPDFLDWVADRLVEVHGERPYVDYVLSLRERAVAMRLAIAKATGAE